VTDRPEDRVDRAEVAVVLPAAGSGTRLGGRRKQFRELGGRPLLVQTLLVFERHPMVDHIVVATPEDAVEPLRHELRHVGITKMRGVVPGGATRQESVAAAIDAVPDAVDVVLVHDAVRPFVRLSLVTALIEAVRTSGAAAPALEVADTLRRAKDGVFGETMEREDVFRMQTPQGFRRDWIARAHRLAAAQGWLATDDVDLVQRSGNTVSLIPGSGDNVKITTPDDWERAVLFWPLWEQALRMEEQARRVMTEVRNP
jgi:2-C-methyl-D-erythritol 4-phosphate cytidylyltransferase